MPNTLLSRLATHASVRRCLIPLAHAYVRYAPFTAGKRAFWTEVVDPCLAWDSYEFVAKTVFGSRIAGNTADIIPQYIYYFGVWEPHLTRWLAEQLTPGDTFIDVGAHIGYFSLLASKLAGESGKVVAIEASPTTFQALQGNLARNRACNVRAINLAVWDATGFVPLFEGPENHTGLSTIVEAEGRRRGRRFDCDVQAAPLDSILRPEEARNARVVKIDVEGAEWQVVAGMKRLLNSGRDDLEIVLEVNPERLARQGKRPEDLLAFFADAGFHAYWLENDYSPLSYLSPQPDRRPLRVEPPIYGETDVIFSRRDAERL